MCWLTGVEADSVDCDCRPVAMLLDRLGRLVGGGCDAGGRVAEGVGTGCVAAD